LTLGTLAIPLRAASNPRAGNTEKPRRMDDEDLERLRPLGLISVVGQPEHRRKRDRVVPPVPYVNAQDPEWYAEQGAKLQAQHEQRG